ncbi:LysR substrate-binding domain-containing protein [Marinobacter oulmenensis]|uniref:Putative choline sulfate-utilization transcription factor n=1 Tax=Marinobacter oulmenensis TaxID=643747 RepID=A0A840U5J5_9GAMM|nr:LysR substrate-binding domain-containing protein [Marinobacter oulmenensis]MBB5320212.1 putative choline sulfate-utilization transcription factor [Marinobacter oulmenensis]
MFFESKRISPNSLRVFESAARHLSFTAAARDLRSTQSAVSQQVRALEEQLGFALFDRVYRGVRLTEPGQVLFASVQEGFGTIERTIDRLQQHQSNPRVNILTDFSLATYWLMPRLPEFRKAYPNIDVRIMTNQGVFDWHGQGVDVAIVFQDRKGLEGVPRLLHEEVVPVCSPGFLEQAGPINELSDLGGLPLLTLTADQGQCWLDWPDYFDCLGGEPPMAPPELIFNNYPLLVQAAIAGQGVALGWRGLIDVMLDRRMLVGLEHLGLCTSGGYAVIDGHPEENNAAKALFLDWMLSC